MKARFDEETGYLYIEDAQDGIKILSKDRYTELKRSADEADSLRDQLKELEGLNSHVEQYNKELERGCIRVEAINDMLQEQLKNERERNNRLLIKIVDLKGLLDNIRDAAYWQAFSDINWKSHNRSLNEVGKRLTEATKDYPDRMESCFNELVRLITNVQEACMELEDINTIVNKVSEKCEQRAVDFDTSN